MVQENSFNKKIYTLFFIVFILVASLSFYFFHYKKRSLSYEFDGRLKSLNGLSINMEGAFIFSQNPKPAGPLSPMNVNIGQKTIINKTIIHLPTQEQLKATNGYFDGRKLKRDKMMADIDTFTKDISETKTGVNIFAKSKANIYNKNSFEAIEIIYEIVI